MDWKNWSLSIGAVFGILYVTGLLLSALSGYLQCSKAVWGESAKQGAIWAVYPTIIYAVGSYFTVVRQPFTNTFLRFNVFEDKAPILAVGYLVMLMIWITSSMMINNIKNVACNPDVVEMSQFKQKLLAELQQKQKEEEKNNEADVKKPAT